MRSESRPLCNSCLVLGVALLGLVGLTAPAFAGDFAKDVQTAASQQSGGGDNSSGAVPLGDKVSASDPLANFGPPSGTIVSNRALELREEVLQLRVTVNKDSAEYADVGNLDKAGYLRYKSTIAAITTRLKNGTTRGNPILVRQWNDADSELNGLTSSYDRLNALQTSIDTDYSVANYLMSSIRASFDISGAVDEDHDQLKLLQDDVQRQVTQLDYLRTQTAAAMARQNSYITTERANMRALSHAISLGKFVAAPVAVPVAQPPMVPQAASMPVVTLQKQPVASAPPVKLSSMPQASTMDEMPPEVTAPKTASMVHRLPPASFSYPSAQAPAAPPTPEAPVAASDSATLGHLLLIVRFDREDVDYGTILQDAIDKALSLKHDARFAIVAVSPSEGTAADIRSAAVLAKRKASDIKRIVVKSGVEPSDVVMAATRAPGVSTAEVRVYAK